MSSRFRNFKVFLPCLARFLAHGKADKILDPPKSIAVIHTAQLGDMVCTTPLFRAIKKHLPHAELIVFGNRPSIEILEGNPDVDRRIIKSSLPEMIRTLKELKPDLGCVVIPDFQALAALYLAGVPAVITPEVKNSFSTGSTVFYNIIKNFVITVPFFKGKYFPRQYLTLLEPIGIKEFDTTKHLQYSKNAQHDVDEFFVQNSIIPGEDLVLGLSVSAGNKVKVWPADRFAALMDYLWSAYGAKILLLGGPKDGDEVAAVMGSIGHDTQIINCVNEFSLDQLKALVSKLDLFISVDTGPIYIAEAFGTPTIDIVGPFDEREQVPTGAEHLVVGVHEGNVQPQLSIINARIYDEQEARRQVEAISVQMVIDAVSQLIGPPDTRT